MTFEVDKMTFEMVKFYVGPDPTKRKLAEFHIDPDRNQITIFHQAGTSWEDREAWLEHHGAIKYDYQPGDWRTIWPVTEELCALFLLRWA